MVEVFDTHNTSHPKLFCFLLFSVKKKTALLEIYLSDIKPF